MKKLITILAIIFVLYILFHKTPDVDTPIGEGNYSFSFTHQGRERLYNVHVPESYDSRTSVPLVINFHGGGGDMEAAATQSDMNAKSEEAGFIVVYPQGVVRPISKIFGLSGGTWNAGVAGGGYAYDNNIDDVGFISKMLDELELQYKIDRQRIYSTGLSMGGMMSYRLACELSDRIAAIAPIASNLVLDQTECTPSRPISVMHFQGTADRVVPYNGGESDPTLPKYFVVGGPYKPIQETINFFADLNSCNTDKRITYQKGEVVCQTQDSCSGNTEVILCTIDGGGHTWPGGIIANTDGKWQEYVGKITQDISATAAMWNFFQKHSLSN